MGLSKHHNTAETRGLRRLALHWRLTRRGLLLAALVLILVVLFYAEENHRGPRVWERCRVRLLSRGVELDWHKLAPPTVPDEENFATTPFLAALFDYAPGTYTPRDLNAYNAVAGFAEFEPPYAEARRSSDPVPAINLGHRLSLTEGLQRVQNAKRPGNSGHAHQPDQAQDPAHRRETADALLGALEQFGPILNELQSATGRPQARFNLNYGEEYSWAVPQPHLPVLERITQVLCWRGCSELAVEDPAAATRDTEFIVDLAWTLRAEPLRNSFFVRNAMLDHARQILWEGLAAHQWSPSELTDLQTRLERFTWRDIQAQIQVDRSAGNGTFEIIHKNPSIVNGWTFGSSVGDKARGFFLRHMPVGWMYLEQAAYQNRFDECVAPALSQDPERIYPKRFVSPTPVFLALGRHRLLADLLLYSARYLCRQAAWAQTGISQARIACALERYRQVKGQFPATLDGLSSVGMPNPPLDLLTGQPMKYRLAPDGQFVLYSVGWNEQDDGGKTVMDPRTKAPDPEQGDWVWPAYPR